MTSKEFKLKHFGTKKFYLHLAGFLALCAGCADSQDPVRFTPKQQFEKSLRGNWSYPCKSKFRDIDIEDDTFQIQATEFSSQRILIYTNSDKLVIKDRFFKGASCEDDTLGCSHTIIYSFSLGDAVDTEAIVETSPEQPSEVPAQTYEIDLKATEGGDFDNQVDPEFCKEIEAVLPRDEEIYSLVRVRGNELRMGVSSPDRQGKTADGRHSQFDPDQTATRF